MGPFFSDAYFRYALAGTAATLAVELLTHGIDTINMRSKVINGPKINLLQYLRMQDFISLFRGVPAVIYGYILSSMVYFYCYAKLKDFIKKGY